MICILVLIWKLPKISTIQKPYQKSFPVPIASFVDALRPEKFSGKHFKRWYVKITDWLTTKEVFWVIDGLPEGDIFDKDRSKFQKANDIFVGVVRNVLLNHLFDSMMHIRDANPLWIIAPTLSREISKERTKKRRNNSLSIPKQLLPLRRRRKICLRCRVSLVVN
jgi:hypothetical protein